MTWAESQAPSLSSWKEPIGDRCGQVFPELRSWYTIVGLADDHASTENAIRLPTH
jgi:hypothetical protein